MTEWERHLLGLGVLGMLSWTSSAQGQTLVNSIDISEAGAGKRMLLGDVTGDGLLDVVMMQGDQMSDDRYVGHQVNCLTAYDWHGNLLWQVGNPASGSSTGSDIPAQIYDIDGDGANEVLACMNNDVVSNRFVVLDGRTGAIEEQYDYPAPEAHDAIIIANLSGADQAADVALKDRYENLWAMDRNWELLFSHAGNVGHYPWPADYDGDGVEELMAGYDFLESDGRRVWSVTQEGHADCIWVGDVDENPANGKEIALGGSDLTVYDKNGALIAREDAPVEPQNIAIGDFRPDLPGLEIGGQDRRDRGEPGEEAIFLWSPMQGEMLFYNTRSGWGSIANMVHNWDGTGRDLISIWRGPAAPALFDGTGTEVASFAEGYLMTGDVDGDGTSEVITFTESQALLYSFNEIDLERAATGTPRPQPKMQYNFTRYWGGEYPPFGGPASADPAEGGAAGAGSDDAGMGSDGQGPAGSGPGGQTGGAAGNESIRGGGGGEGGAPNESPGGRESERPDALGGLGGIGLGGTTNSGGNRPGGTNGREGESSGGAPSPIGGASSASPAGTGGGSSGTPSLGGAPGLGGASSGGDANAAMGGRGATEPGAAVGGAPGGGNGSAGLGDPGGGAQASTHLGSLGGNGYAAASAFGGTAPLGAPNAPPANAGEAGGKRESDPGGSCGCSAVGTAPMLRGNLIATWIGAGLVMLGAAGLRLRRLRG